MVRHYMKKVLTITLLSLTMNLANASSSYPVQCPEKISVTQNISAQYDGWRSFTGQSNYYLNGVTLFSGKPEDRVSLVPKFNRRNKSVWNFSTNDQIYISCAYNQTSIELTQALPAHTTGCTVLYDTTVSSTNGFVPKQILCDSSN